MVGVTAVLVGYLASIFWPDTFNGSINSPTLMIGFCIVFAILVSYIAHRGVTGSTGVNIAINVIQISALLIFAVIALGYRMNHGEGSVGWTLDPDGTPINVVLETGATAIPLRTTKAITKSLQENGKDKPFVLAYTGNGVTMEPVDSAKPDSDKQATFQFHETASSVVAPHGFSFVIIQACIAILILVGFESVTSMGEEAKNAKRDIPRRYCSRYSYKAWSATCLNTLRQVISSTRATKSLKRRLPVCPLADMMKLAGTWLFGSPQAGLTFMLIQAATVFWCSIGTTLSCMNTGARVTYAMGRDDEVPSHFGMLHGKNLSPHRAIWTLCFVSIIVGIVSVVLLAGLRPLRAYRHITDRCAENHIWYPSFLQFSSATAAAFRTAC